MALVFKTHCLPAAVFTLVFQSLGGNSYGLSVYHYIRERGLSLLILYYIYTGYSCSGGEEYAAVGVTRGKAYIAAAIISVNATQEHGAAVRKVHIKARGACSAVAIYMEA